MAFLDAIRWLRMISILIVWSQSSGCATSPYRAPVEEAASIPSYRLQTHTVAPGETLYSIAWRYDLDHKKMAEINGLGEGYKIRPGQILALYSADYAPVKPVVKTRAEVALRQVKTPTAPRKPVQQVSKFQSKKKNSAPNPIAPTQGPAWHWPVKGPIVSQFHGNGGLNRGIDISGKLGEPVVAAANGEVVYSGSGLRGYGKLLIVKHDEKYLSAYAHNRVLHVAEGDRVKAGQKIAELGDTGTNTPKLHFEIRYDGQPVDPLKHLPKR